MVANIPCHLSIFNCKSECGCEMACDHACTSKCCECYSETVQSDVPIERDVNNHVIRKVHRKCQVKCDKNLQCGHRYSNFIFIFYFLVDDWIFAQIHEKFVVLVHSRVPVDVNIRNALLFVRFLVWLALKNAAVQIIYFTYTFSF